MKDFELIDSYNLLTLWKGRTGPKPITRSWAFHSLFILHHRSTFWTDRRSIFSPLLGYFLRYLNRNFSPHGCLFRWFRPQLESLNQLSPYLLKFISFL